MFTVPTILNMLTRHEAVDRYDHSSLRYVIYAGSPMYRADQRHALAKLGKVLVQYYGMGEVTGAITVLPAAMHSLDDAAMPVGSCGYPRTGICRTHIGFHEIGCAPRCFMGSGHAQVGETIYDLEIGTRVVSHDDSLHDNSSKS